MGNSYFRSSSRLVEKRLVFMLVRGPEALSGFSLLIPSLFFLQCINFVLIILKISLCWKYSCKNHSNSFNLIAHINYFSHKSACAQFFSTLFNKIHKIIL